VLAGFLWSTWGLPAVMGARVLLAITTELYVVALTRSTESRPLGPASRAREDDALAAEED